MPVPTDTTIVWHRSTSGDVYTATIGPDAFGVIVRDWLSDGWYWTVSQDCKPIANDTAPTAEQAMADVEWAWRVTGK